MDLDAGLFQMRIKVNFLRRHRLRLNDAFHAVLPRQIENIVADLGGSVVRNTLVPRLRLLRESVGELSR